MDIKVTLIFLEKIYHYDDLIVNRKNAVYYLNCFFLFQRNSNY